MRLSLKSVFESGTPFVSPGFSVYFDMQNEPFSAEFRVEIPDQLHEVPFACDLSACKGACCTIPGGRGAPLLDAEVARIEHAATIVKDHLSSEHQKVLAESGTCEGGPGSFHTTLVDGGPCVFVVFQDGVARCSIEQAYFKGLLDWRKPISCHLFPLRVDKGVVDRVRYEQLQACDPAVERGMREGISLIEFTREALTRAYGPNDGPDQPMGRLGTKP